MVHTGIMMFGTVAGYVCGMSLNFVLLKIVLFVAYMSMMESFIVALIMAEGSDAVLLVQGMEMKIGMAWSMEIDSVMVLAGIGRPIRHTKHTAARIVNILAAFFYG